MSRGTRVAVVTVLWLLTLVGAAGNTVASMTGAGVLTRLGFGLLAVCCLGLLILLRLLRHRN